MSSVVAIVKSIVGQVFVISPEGARRVLVEGDRLFAGDQIDTGMSGAVSLELADGRTLDLGRDTQWSADTPDSTLDLAAATEQAAPSVAELQQAIAAGADPTTDLEATAAGPAAAGNGAAGGGHSFVVLDATAGRVDPTIGFPTAPIGQAGSTATQLTGAQATTGSGNLVLQASTLTLSATPTITEAGGVLTYTATVTQAPVNDLTITLSNGAVITITAGQLTGTVNVPLAPNDSPYIDPSQINVNVTGTTGGTNLVLTVDPKPAVTQVTDTIDTTTVTLTAGQTVTEGGQITYTATLTNPAQTPVTITLSNGSVITIKAGESTGTVVVDTPANDVYNNGSTVSTTITGATGGNFESLVPSTTPAVTTLVDSIDTTTVTLTAGQTVVEGGQITYTATLTNPAQTPVTITLSNGSVITIKAGESTGTVVVDTPANDVYNNGSTVSTTITGATGGNFESLVPSTTPAVTTITDSIDTTTVTLTADNSVVEGGNITYTATLTNPAQTAVTVTLSNGQTIVIEAGKTSGTVVFQTPANDVYNNGSTVNTTITKAEGGNFENLATNPAPATTTITDSIDTTTVTLTADNSVVEGGNITYTATLTNPAQTAVTVTLSNGQTITIEAGKTSGTVVFQTPANDVYNNGSTVNTTITKAEGGNFENLATNPAPATTTITDSIDTTTVTLTADNSVVEGGNITYTATLTNPAQTAVTVTLSNGQTITIEAGKTAGSVVFQTPANDVYNNSSTVNTTITKAEGGNFENLATNPAPATTTITDSIDTTTVTLTADNSVVEGGNITYTATLTNPAQTAVTVTLSNGQTITIEAGKTTGSVVFQTPANDVYNNSSTVNTTITKAEGGNFENLATNPAPATTTITDSIDTTTVTLTADNSVVEGGNITYTATLTNPAQTAVTVTLSNGQTIVIEAGKTSGTVVFQTPANDVYNNGSTVNTTITKAEGGNFENLATNPAPATTTITDSIDTTTVTLTADNSVVEGGNITYTATLTNPAQTAVTVTLSNGQTIVIEAGKSSGTVVFQTPANDVYNNGSTVNTTITKAEGGNFENLATNPAPATTTITDSIDTTTVTLTADNSVVEGGNITYTATLTNPAQTAVTVTLSNGQTITIEAGKTAGSVVFQTPANDVYNNGSTVNTTITKAEGGNFENLATNPAPATTTITDSIDTTTVTLTADNSVVEGGNITYTATLTNPAQTAVTVTLSNGQTITIEAGKTTGTVVFETPANDVYNNGSTVNTTITKAEGGNFENLVANPAPATTTITDSIDTTTVTLTADNSVVEGGNITYTATLTNPAQTAVTVTLSNGQTIVIEAGKSSGTVVFQTPANDVYNNGSTVNTTITKAEGGNFENLATNPAPATTTITDSIDTTTVTLTADNSVVEGGNITYTATLTNPAQTAVTVTLSNGQTITIEAGKTAGSVVFQTPANDVYNNGSTVNTTITKAEGGNFENLATNPAPATTTITDSIDTTTVTLTADNSVVEGGNITYTATLTNPAQTAVTVTLSNGQTITIEAGKTAGSVVFQTPANDVYNNGSTVNTTITKAEGGNFENLATNPAPATTTITDSIDTTTVTLTADNSVVEGGNITYTATLTNPAQTAVTVTLSNGQTITIEAGKTAGSVVFQTPANDVYNNGSTVNTTITKAEGGNFENLATNPAPATTTITDSIDTTTVTLTADNSVVEGGNITYTATLTNPAQTAVTVTLSNGQTIVIEAGKTSGTVVFETPANDVYNNGSTVNTTITKAEGGNFENLATNPAPATTTITDSIDTTTVTLTADNSVVEGGNITYTATLTNPAQTAVTVTLSNGQTITIEAGKTAGSVVFETPANDVYNNGSTVNTTITKAEGGNFENLATNPAPATTTITDSIDTTTVTLTADNSVVEGGNITYTATLTNPAQTAVTVTLSNGQTITIEAGKTTGTVVFETPANDVYNNGSTVNTTITKAEGGNFENLVANPAPATTTITDSIDTTTVTLTADNSVVEGGNITYTATLTNPAQTAVTVTLSNGQTITIEAGKTAGSVVFQTPANDVYNNGSTVNTTITKAEGGNFENLATNPAPATTTITDSIDTTTVTLTADNSVVEGGNITYTATLTNPAQTAVTVTLSNGQTITIEAGKTAGSVVFQTPANDVYNNGSTVNTTITKAEGGNFENLATNPAPATTTITDSIDTTTVTLTADNSVVEGGNITYTATLTNPAQTAVTVTLSNGQTITIEAGKTTGSVVFQTPANDVYNNSSTVNTTITKAEGGNFENLATNPAPATTTITDSIDTTTVTLTADNSVVEGGNITYTATLTNPAQTAVTVTLSNGQTIVIEAGKSSGTVVFQTPANDVYNNGSTVNTTITKAEGGNFENLATNPAPATTTITDSIDTTTVTLTADNSVVEGGNITYTATLTNPAQTAVTVTLSNGQTITIEAGKTAGSVVFHTPANDVYNNGSTVNTTITKAEGGNFENLATNPAPATTTITDSIDTTTVTLTADNSVVEGGNITYTATLTNPAQTAVTVTLSNGQTITIEAGKTAGSVVFQTPANDVYNNGSTVNTTITKAEGGNFENLATNPAPATTTITDSIDTTTVTLTANASVVEGGDITYTATLTNPAQTAVTVTLSNGQTINIEAGKSTGSVVFHTPANDVYNNGSTVNTTITKAEGGNFENLAANPAPATTTITDSIDTTTVTLTANASVVEGGDITYTATLTNPAQTAVTVTLSNGQTINIEAGKSTGTVVFHTPANDVYNNGSTVNTTITKAEGGNFENLAANPAPATTTITDSIDTTTVTLTANASVVEGGDITYTATLTNPAQTAVTVTLSNGQTINIEAGKSTGTVVFHTPANDVYNNGSTVNTTITKAEGGNFENLVANPAPATTTITDSIDTTTVTLTADNSVVEGGNITYTATLTNPAQTAVTVTLSNGQTIVIEAGKSSGSVVSQTPANDVYNNGSTVSTTITKAEGGNFENLAANPAPATTTITDSIDTTTVTLTANASVVEGGDITYTATLTNPAQTAVTVTLSNGQTINIEAGKSTGSVVFHTPANDVYNNGSTVSTTITKAEGGNFENLAANPAPATTTITDSIDTTTVTLTANASVVEGGDITYTATLTNPAQTAVTVTLSNGQTINIEAGKSTGSVVFHTPANDVYNNSSTVSTTITNATGGNFENLAKNPAPAVTTITDSIDTTTVTLTATPSVVEGGTITYTATLTNPAQTAVTVTLSNGQTINIEAGKSTGSVVFQTPPNDVYNNASTVSTTITKATGGNFENLAANPAPATTSITDSIDTTTVTLTAPSAVNEGGTITYTATLSNKAGSDMVITLDNGSSITIKQGATVGSVTVNAPGDDVFIDKSTQTVKITGTTGGNFENLAVTPGGATTVVNDTIDTVRVLLTATGSVGEKGNIVYTATLVDKDGHVVNNVGKTVVIELDNGKTISIADGQSASTVTVVAPNDVYAGTQTVTAAIKGVTGGEQFENLVPVKDPVSTTVYDTPATTDLTTVTLTAPTAVNEGGTITYTATLSNKAGSDMVVTLDNGSTITIKQGATVGTVTVNAPGDDVFIDKSTQTVKITGTTGGNFEGVSITPGGATTTINDTIDDVTVSLKATGSVSEGGQITYTASLVDKNGNAVKNVGSDLVVKLDNGSTITIGNGQSSSTTTATAPNDAYVGANDVTAKITNVVSGGDKYEHLIVDGSTVTTKVTDVVNNTTISITGDASVTEGGVAHYTLTLSNPAQTDVTVTLKYSGTATDGSDFNGVYTVKIPAGSSSVPFTIGTIDDKITEPTETIVITIDKTTGGNFENLVVGNGSVSTNIIDNDAPPVIDLDANNSSGATGADYKVTFTEGTAGPGVSIADTDIKITDPDSTMLTGATITLTNAQAGDALNLGNSVNGITVSTNNQTGTITLTLSGSATLADYMQRIQNITFTNSSHDPSTTPRTITVTVTDGGNYSNVATTTVNVVAVNDAPVATGSAVTGTEDTPLALTWANFGVTDVDSPQSSLGVKITDLPVAGKLQYLAADGTTWANVTAGQTFTKAQIDGGQLRFMPNANESGADGYGGTGIGNKQADYAQFKFQPTDGKDLGTSATVKVDITPVADAPTLNVADNSVNSVGLIKQSWNSLSGIGTNGNGAAPADLKNAIDNAGTPNSSAIVTNVESTANVAAGSGSKISGLMYMEAGKTYTFSGVADDSLVINIGGKDVASGLWGTNSGKFSGSITPTVSGYYSIEIYHANQSGPGSYDVNLSVNGAPAQDLSTSGVPLYTGITDLTNAGVTVSDLHGSNGDGYYVGYKLNEGQENGTVKLSKVTTALTDTDGSETLSVKISGIPAGSVLTDASGHTFTATKGVGEVNVTGWDLGSLTIKPPTYYSGQFNLTVTSTSTESLGGSAVTTAQLPVTVYPATYNAVTGTSGSDAINGTDGNDIVVADIGGLNVVQGKNYNIAFMVDSSGSMTTASINAAKASLTSVFNALKDSLGSNTSGTVNIFLADFDTQVNKSVAINLNDPNALNVLKGVLDSMVSGGGTNYEDVFKTTANFFQSGLATSNTGATNLTYFITDGQPTYYQSGEQTNPTLYGNVKFDDVVTMANYTPGTAVGKYLDNTHYFSIDTSGAAALQTYNGSRWVYTSLGTVHAQGDGTFELSNLSGTGNSTDSATLSNAKSAFALLGGLSQVEAIGINGDVSLSDLKPYDSDGKPQTNIDPKDLANAILGHTEATLPGADTINGGDGNDIIFGDLVSFSGITGEGYNALQAFVAQKTGVAVSAVTPSNVHQYVTEHYADFDVSGAKDGNDTLLGGAGDDILFGQGGNDYLDGGKGNDILLGGTGNDTLIGGPGNDILIGGSGADTFVWKSGDFGNDVIKDFKASEGDRIDLRDLLKGETDSTIDNYLKITTVDGVSTLQVSSEGKLNAAGGLANADVTIKLEGNDWSHTSINSLITGADPTIKIDHTA